MRTINGESLIVEFKSENGLPQYEFQVGDKTGTVWYLECDAATGHIVEIERHVTIDDPAFKAGAKISQGEAEAIALSRIPGTIDRRETLMDDSGPVYEFDIIATAGGEFKVEVDAATGAVHSVSPEYWEIGEYI